MRTRQAPTKLNEGARFRIQRRDWVSWEIRFKNLLGGPNSVHARHWNVQKNKTELVVLQSFERFQPVVRNLRGVTDLTEDLLDDLLVDLVIFNEEDSERVA